MPYQDARDRFIAQTVKGKSFAEVGGLWGTVNEKISVAHEHGARSLTMIDVTPADGELWSAFDARLRSLNVPGVARIVGDVSAQEVQGLGLCFDVVHCSGVLYHHPNPLQLLIALRSICNENLILTSAITRENIKNAAGSYALPESGVLFVPALNDSERAVVAAYWRAVGAVAYGITDDARFDPNDFGPWWWLPTANALKAMCTSVGFLVLDTAHIWGDNALTLLLGRAR